MSENKEAKTTELKLSPLKTFTGKREELDNFIQDIYLYLDVNSDTYNTEKKKIGYMLSFMNSGNAKSWKAQFLRNLTKNTRLDLETWADFIAEIKKAFKPYNAPGDALEE